MKYIFYFILFLCCFLPLTVIGQISKDTTTTDSGLKYIILESGTGEKVAEGMEISAHYSGKFLDGKVFDSSYDRNEPITLILGAGSVIRGWEEGLLLMSVGDKYRFILPPELAYGDKGAGDVIPPNSTLIFDIEVVSQSDPRISTADAMYITLKESGIDSAIAKYHDLKGKFPTIFDFREKELIGLGYKLFKEGNFEACESVMLLNLEQFPNSQNTMTGLSEVYKAQNDTVNEIKILKKYLELNPKDNEAKQRLAELEK